MLYVAWKRGPWKFAPFVLFHPIKKRSFNLLCVLDLFRMLAVNSVSDFFLLLNYMKYTPKPCWNQQISGQFQPLRVNFKQLCKRTYKHNVKRFPPSPHPLHTPPEVSTQLPEWPGTIYIRHIHVTYNTYSCYNVHAGKQLCMLFTKPHPNPEELLRSSREVKSNDDSHELGIRQTNSRHKKIKKELWMVLTSCNLR